jgi:hypothetical protein
MKLAFKRSSGFIGKAIDRLSGRDGFSHVELVFSDGRSFSSTSLDKEKGVRFKDIAYSHPKEWVNVQLFPPFGAEAKIREMAESLIPAPYDTRGVLRFIIPWMKEHPKAYFCSEAVITALQAGGMFSNLVPHTVGPNVLWRISSAEEARLAHHLEVG